MNAQYYNNMPKRPMRLQCNICHQLLYKSLYTNCGVQYVDLEAMYNIHVHNSSASHN